MRALAGVMTVLCACSAQHQKCSDRAFNPSGDARTDIVGTWGWYGIDTAEVLAAHADGGWETVEITPTQNYLSERGFWFADGGAVFVSCCGYFGFVDGGHEPSRFGHPLTCEGVTP